MLLLAVYVITRSGLAPVRNAKCEDPTAISTQLIQHFYYTYTPYTIYIYTVYIRTLI